MPGLCGPLQKGDSLCNILLTTKTMQLHSGQVSHGCYRATGYPLLQECDSLGEVLRDALSVTQHASGSNQSPWMRISDSNKVKAEGLRFVFWGPSPIPQSLCQLEFRLPCPMSCGGVCQKLAGDCAGR